MDLIFTALIAAITPQAFGGSPALNILTAPARAATSVFRCTGCERDANGKIKRSKAKARKFLREIGWDLPTDGIRVDHIIALGCGPSSGSYDDLGNMQLQWATEAAAKDSWELSPHACDPATQAKFLQDRGQLMPSAHSRTRPAQHAVDGALRMREEYKAGRRR